MLHPSSEYNYSPFPKKSRQYNVNVSSDSKAAPTPWIRMILPAQFHSTPKNPMPLCFHLELSVLKYCLSSLFLLKNIFFCPLLCTLGPFPLRWWPRNQRKECNIECECSLFFCLWITWGCSEGTPGCASQRQTTQHLGRHRRETRFFTPHKMKPWLWHQLIDIQDCPLLSLFVFFLKQIRCGP